MTHTAVVAAVGPTPDQRAQLETALAGLAHIETFTHVEHLWDRIDADEHWRETLTGVVIYASTEWLSNEADLLLAQESIPIWADRSLFRLILTTPDWEAHLQQNVFPGSTALVVSDPAVAHAHLTAQFNHAAVATITPAPEPDIPAPPPASTSPGHDPVSTSPHAHTAAPGRYDIVNERTWNPADIPRHNTALTVSVISSKGGCGKSFVAFGLATTYARAAAAAGKPIRVCLIDMDLNDGQVGTFINDYEPTVMPALLPFTQNGGHLTNDDLENPLPGYQEPIYRYDPKSGVHCILAPREPSKSLVLSVEFWQSLITTVRHNFDVVIIDHGAHNNKEIEPHDWYSYDTSDYIVAVADVNKSALFGLARTLQQLTRPAGQGSGLGIPPTKIRYLVNKAAVGLGITPEEIHLSMRDCDGNPIQSIGAIPNLGQEVIMWGNTHQYGLIPYHPDGGEYFFNAAARLATGTHLDGHLTSVAGGMK